MRRIARKAHNAILLALLGGILSACSAGDPSRVSEYAVQGLYSAALSKDGSAALVSSIQHGGSYWQTSNDQRQFSWNHAQGEFTPLISVDIDPSGHYAVTGGARTMVLWNTQSGRSEGFWNTPGGIQSIKLSNNGDFAIVGMDDQTARYFDVKNGGILQTFRTGASVRSVDVDSAGRVAVTGDDLSKVTLWSIGTGKVLFTWELNNRIATVTLSDNGDYVFGAAQLGEAKIWSTRTGEEVMTLPTGSLPSRNITINKARFSPDNLYLLTGEANRRVRLFGLTSGQILKEWSLHLRDPWRPVGASVLALAFGRADTYYAIGSNGYLNVLE